MLFECDFKFKFIRVIFSFKCLKSNRSNVKIDQEKRAFQEKWGYVYFFTNSYSLPICLICKQSVSSVIKEYNTKRHYDTNHGKIYDKFVGKLHGKQFEKLKKNLSHQAKLFDDEIRENNDSVKCSYVISEKIARASEPFSDGEFIRVYS